MLEYIKERICFILLGILFTCICLVIINAVYEGIERIITEEMIIDTYRIHQ